MIIDTVSPVPEARRGWRDLAAAANEHLKVIELEVSDRVEHQRPVESRVSDIDGLVVPTWQQVTERVYQPWDEQRDGTRLKLSNGASVKTSFAAVLAFLEDQ